jgi:hypothetical protein
MATLNGTVVLFGGTGANSSVLGDTWIWNGTTWTEANVSGPSARYYHAMATLNGTVVLFGGCPTIDCSAPLSDTWTWNGTGWTQIGVTGPSARDGHAMAAW